MNAREFIGGQFLSAENINGQVLTGRIIGIGAGKVESRSGKAREKISIDVEGVQKPVLLNQTNLKRIVSAFGDDTDEWLGHEVRIGTHDVQFGGELVKGLRVDPVFGKSI